MRVFKSYLSLVAIVALLFTSCSKEEATKNDPGGDSGTISFATMLNDMMDKSQAVKQEIEGELPECSDAAPAYVEIILTDGDGNPVVGAPGTPQAIDVNSTPGDYDSDGEDEYFTEYDELLELPEGDYTLTHFVVFDGSGNVIWVAPQEGSDYDVFVNDALPIDIHLDAGTKLYVDVEVLCFDDRDVIKYGYLFFEIEDIPLQEICFFVNYCDENGRHFSGYFAVSISEIDGATFYENVPNVTGWTEAQEPYADPLCFAVPVYEGDNPNEPYLEYTLILQDWGDNYGDVEQVEIHGLLSQAAIEDYYTGDDEVNYIHIFIGCDPTGGECPGDIDCDGTPDDCDPCDEQWGQYNGCPYPVEIH